MLLLIIHYLYRTRRRGIILRPGDPDSAKKKVLLRIFTDVGYACHANGKSQYTICFELIQKWPGYSELHPLRKIYNTAMFYFRSFMAPTVDLATCQGEIGSLVEGVKDGIFIRGVLKEIHRNKSSQHHAIAIMMQQLC